MIGDGYISYPFLSVELGIDMGIGNGFTARITNLVVTTR